MNTLIAFATQWGSKYGGINSFNTDFLEAFGFAYQHAARVICIVASATESEIATAAKSGVTLIPLPYAPKEKELTEAHGEAAIAALEQRGVPFDARQTVCLGHDRITGAAALAAALRLGARSAVIHHMSYQHYENFAENASTATSKVAVQKALFAQADIVLSVGPLLRDAVKDLLDDTKQVHMLIPGLAGIDPRPAPKTFTAFLSGRLSEDAARIKQGHLGIAAFAQAYRQASASGMPDALQGQPRLVVRGLDLDRPDVGNDDRKIDPENELKRFAESHANRVVNVQALPFTHSREELYAELSRASVAMMPSWHEGFGLVAWEAIAAGVPLILNTSSGVYRYLQEELPGAGMGCVYAIDVRGSEAEPYHHEEDVRNVVKALFDIAKSPDTARRKAGLLRELLNGATWAACAEQAQSAFDWNLQRGVLPAPSHAVVPPPTPQTVRQPAASSVLAMPTPLWRYGEGMADSQLLRAEEALVPFDSARQPELDKLLAWVADANRPLAVRLVTGMGGLGKTRLALELCQRMSDAGWCAGFLESSADSSVVQVWKTLHEQRQPVLVVIDYAETRQDALIRLLKTILQQGDRAVPVRILLLARDAGEWWENLAAKDPVCESFLNGAATSGPFGLPPLHLRIEDRDRAFREARRLFANKLQVPEPDTVPDLSGEHFGRPLYLQMAALLALHGERPATANDLTRALLNHETRYWRGLLQQYGWQEPEQLAAHLLALATLSGGFAIPRQAQAYWQDSGGRPIGGADLTVLFHALAALYPGKQGLQPVRPDLLGEALIAQALSKANGEPLLNAVLGKSASQAMRRHALTVLVRVSAHRPDLHETIVNALAQQFIHCATDAVVVATETPGPLPKLVVQAFERLSLGQKSQAAGQLVPYSRHESVQLAEMSCLVWRFLVEKHREKLNKKTSMNPVDRANYASALRSYSIALFRMGVIDEATVIAKEGWYQSKCLVEQECKQYEPEYANSLGNYANRLSDVGQTDAALDHARQALEIHKRLAGERPDRFEPDYALSLSNYANHLSDVGQTDAALDHVRQALEIDKRLAGERPDRFEPDYARSLSNYASHLSAVGQTDAALDHARQALEIHKRLADERPDRFEPDYARSLSNYASHLSAVGQTDAALDHARQALEIRKRLADERPDRFEPGYALSLNNYANRLSDVGRTDAALDHARQALEIRKRLAGERPDRFEPDYAWSLRNYANHLRNVGQANAAFEQVMQSRAIYQRLAGKMPLRYREDEFTVTVIAVLLSWLVTGSVNDEMAERLREYPSLPPHRLRIVQALAASASACASSEQSLRESAFESVLRSWPLLSMTGKIEVRPYWLCAAAYCAAHAQALAPETGWQTEWPGVWATFSAQVRGNIPWWMQETARRLDFTFS